MSLQILGGRTIEDVPTLHGNWREAVRERLMNMVRLIVFCFTDFYEQYCVLARLGYCSSSVTEMKLPGLISVRAIRFCLTYDTIHTSLLPLSTGAGGGAG